MHNQPPRGTKRFGMPSHLGTFLMKAVHLSRAFVGEVLWSVSCPAAFSGSKRCSLSLTNNLCSSRKSHWKSCCHSFLFPVESLFLLQPTVYLLRYFPNASHFMFVVFAMFICDHYTAVSLFAHFSAIIVVTTWLAFFFLQGAAPYLVLYLSSRFFYYLFFGTTIKSTDFWIAAVFAPCFSFPFFLMAM